jgi:5-methylcytosine-specific restriction endonuclease McrA
VERGSLAYKERARATSAAWREKNRERDRQNARNYAAAHRQEARDRAARWRADNPERVRQQQASHYARNKERKKQQAAQRRLDKADELRLQRAVNAEAKRAYDREYARLYPERLAAKNGRRRAQQLSGTVVPFTREQLIAKLAYWGNRCWMCGAPGTAIDHVKPLSKGGAHMLCNFRPICPPCNRFKGAKWPFAVGTKTAGQSD